MLLLMCAINFSGMFFMKLYMTLIYIITKHVFNNLIIFTLSSVFSTRSTTFYC